MGSRSFSSARPQIPHLVARRRGGLSGETLDLRLDVEEAFEHLEGEVDGYLVIQDEGTEVHTGHVKLNFAGPGVNLTPDPLDPNKIDVTVFGGGTGTGNLQLAVDYTHFPGPVLLGTLSAGKTVEKAVLEVTTAFDGGVRIIVGDATAMGRLMPADANSPAVLGSYVQESNYRYAVDTEIYLYFVSGTTPTVGELRALVYYS